MIFLFVTASIVIVTFVFQEWNASFDLFFLSVRLNWPVRRYSGDNQYFSGGITIARCTVVAGFAWFAWFVWFVSAVFKTKQCHLVAE